MPDDLDIIPQLSTLTLEAMLEKSRQTGETEIEVAVMRELTDRYNKAEQ